MEMRKNYMTNLPTDDEARKKKIIRYTILIASLLIVCAIVSIIIALACKKNGGNKNKKGNVRVSKSDYKFTSIETVTLPEGIDMKAMQYIQRQVIFYFYIKWRMILIIHILGLWMKMAQTLKIYG
jgi:hypothetical protein